MNGLELGLSHGFRLSAMASYARAMNRYGAYGRGVAAVIAVLVACLFASPAWRIVQLLPLVAGVTLALIDVYATAVDPDAEAGALWRWLSAYGLIPADLRPSESDFVPVFLSDIGIAYQVLDLLAGMFSFSFRRRMPVD